MVLRIAASELPPGACAKVDVEGGGDTEGPGAGRPAVELLLLLVLLLGAEERAQGSASAAPLLLPLAPTSPLLGAEGATGAAGAAAAPGLENSGRS